ncbi:MAG: hypothetical protein V8R51_08430 [Clostridia bacterium]
MNFEIIVFLSGAIGMGLELIAAGFISICRKFKCCMDKYNRNNISKYEYRILGWRKEQIKMQI